MLMPFFSRDLKRVYFEIYSLFFIYFEYIWEEEEEEEEKNSNDFQFKLI